MPEATRPQYKKGSGSEQLPHGAAKGLNDQANLGQDALRFPEADYTKQDEDPQVGKLTDADGVLFRGTDRPEEPISQGASYGLGSDRLKVPVRGDDDEVRRTAEDLLNQNAQDMPSSMKAFLARVARGG